MKLLLISGPTATGKTSLALSLAKLFNADLISADSRQVYQGLDIVTGKDIPPGFHWTKGYYTDGNTRIYGLDLVTPDQNWNAALFQKYARKTISSITRRGKLPIIVGGTGLYLKSLTDNFAFPPNNPDLRRELETLSLEDLKKRLHSLDPARFIALNHSDKNNPRRLIRHIEIATQSHSKVKPSAAYDILHLSLSAPLSDLEPLIRSRVTNRLKADPQSELLLIHSLHLPQTHPAFTTLGFHQLDLYYQNKITRDRLLDLWTTAERQYAKRQITWFAKQTGLTRLQLPVNLSEVVATVQLWYSQGNYGKK